MKAVVQRVSSASVSVRGEMVNKIDNGLLVYLGITHTDDILTANKMVKKISNLRIFEDENNKLNLSINEVGGNILLISQFTLYGDVRKSNRPSFTEAMSGNESEKLYNYVLDKLNENIVTKGGVFGAFMDIESVNKGPVTIIIEY